MKILNILSELARFEDNDESFKPENRYEVYNAYAFEEKNNVIDGSVSFLDRINGVIYAADIDLDVAKNKFFIKEIDVQDQENTYSGDEKDKELLMQLIQMHFDTIKRVLSEDLHKNSDGKQPFNKK